MKAGFPRSARVRTRAEFDAVFQQGRRIAAPMLVLHHLPDDLGPRLGLAVSRKVDPRAVARNRIKRILRDAFRQQRAQLHRGAYVLVARADAGRATPIALRQAFAALLIRAGALPPTAASGTMPPASPSSPIAPEFSGGSSLPAS